MAVERLDSSRTGPGIALATLGVGLSLLIGFSVGNQTPILLIALGGITLLGVVVAATFRPRASLYILLTATVTLPVVPITESRGANVVDILLLPALIGAWLFVPGPRDSDLHPEVLKAKRRLERATPLFVLTAIVSLIAVAFRGYPAWAGDSLLLLLRFVQGLLFYVLAVRLLRPEDLPKVRNALVIGFLVNVLVNVYGIAFLQVPRAGVSWNLLNPEWFISSPNEGGFTVSYLWAVLLAVPYRNRWATAALFVISMLFLVATASRSGILAWVTFVVLWGIVRRKSYILLLPLGLLAAFPLLPEAMSQRITRTLTFQSGTFEVYSSLIRVYAWKTALVVVQHNPILGVGYLCFRFFSSRYNELTLNLGTVENTLLETAAGTGIVGLSAALWLLLSIWRLSRAVGRWAAEGSPGRSLAVIAGPLFAAEFVSNLTGDTLTGMFSAAQLAVFCAMLVAGSRPRATAP